MLFFSISSVSSQSLNDFNDTCDIKENKVLKSNALSSSLSTKTTTLCATTKAKTNTSKTTNKTNTTKTITKKTTNKTNTTKTITKKTSNKTNTTTVNKKTLAKASASFMNSVEKNGKFPKVKISNKNYSNTEYLYLISKAVENDSNSKIEIKGNLVNHTIIQKSNLQKAL